MLGELAERKGKLATGDVLGARGNARIYQRFIGKSFRMSLGRSSELMGSVGAFVGQLQTLSLLVYQFLTPVVDHVPACAKVAAAIHALSLAIPVLVPPVKSLLGSLVTVLVSP